MGIGQSRNEDGYEKREDDPISPEQMDEFLEKTQFSPEEIRHLLLAYRKIGGSSVGDGVISE